MSAIGAWAGCVLMLQQPEQHCSIALPTTGVFSLNCTHWTLSKVFIEYLFLSQGAELRASTLACTLSISPTTACACHWSTGAAQMLNGLHFIWFLPTQPGQGHYTGVVGDQTVLFIALVVYYMTCSIGDGSSLSRSDVHWITCYIALCFGNIPCYITRQMLKHFI